MLRTGFFIKYITEKSLYEFNGIFAEASNRKLCFFLVFFGSLLLDVIVVMIKIVNRFLEECGY